MEGDTDWEVKADDRERNTSEHGGRDRMAGSRQDPGVVLMAMGGDLGPMVAALAGLPDEQRRAMLKTRLEEFARMDDASRSKAMQMMLSAALDLPDESYRKIARTRTEILMGLPAEAQMRLMQTHVSALRQLPEAKQTKETGAIRAILMELPPDKRTMMKEMMEKLGMRVET